MKAVDCAAAGEVKSRFRDDARKNSPESLAKHQEGARLGSSGLLAFAVAHSQLFAIDGVLIRPKRVVFWVKD